MILILFPFWKGILFHTHILNKILIVDNLLLHNILIVLQSTDLILQHLLPSPELPEFLLQSVHSDIGFYYMSLFLMVFLMGMDVGLLLGEGLLLQLL